MPARGEKINGKATEIFEEMHPGHSSQPPQHPARRAKLPGGIAKAERHAFTEQ
jgi:hypothetical protein